jgi:hypothetical protein
MLKPLIANIGRKTAFSDGISVSQGMAGGLVVECAISGQKSDANTARFQQGCQ